MKVTKKQIEQKIKKLEKEHRGGGPSPRLFDPKFKADFIEAVLKCGDNGAQVRLHMNKCGYTLSYKQAHVYMRKLFGKYPVTGRPPKYMKENAKRQLAF